MNAINEKHKITIACRDVLIRGLVSRYKLLYRVLLKYQICAEVGCELN